MLNPEFKAKWLEALRSGKYEQGQYALHRSGKNGSKFCCLGVACELHPKFKGWSRVSFLSLFDSVNSLVGSPGFTATMPGGWMDEIGLSDEHSTVLTDKNDRGCQTFAQIADYIEENL